MCLVCLGGPAPGPRNLFRNSDAVTGQNCAARLGHSQQRTVGFRSNAPSCSHSPNRGSPKEGSSLLRLRWWLAGRPAAAWPLDRVLRDMRNAVLSGVGEGYSGAVIRDMQPNQEARPVSCSPSESPIAAEGRARNDLQMDPIASLCEHGRRLVVRRVGTPLALASGPI